MKKLLTVIKFVLPVLLAMVLFQGASVAEVEAAPDAWSGCGGSGGCHYVVKPGDTLYRIGHRFGVSAHAIASVNGLYDPNLIYVGQVLYIPAGYGYGHGCGYGYGHGCGNYYHDSNYYGCGSNCGNYYHDSGYYGCGSDCGKNYYHDSGYYDCHSDCGYDHSYHKYPSYGYGYNYAGYYYYSYYPNYQQYSHTCGYYYNCY